MRINCPSVHEDKLSLHHEDKLSLRHEDKLSLRHEDKLSLRHEDKLSLRHEDKLSLRHEDKLSLRHEDKLSLRQLAGLYDHYIQYKLSINSNSSYPGVWTIGAYTPASCATSTWCRRLVGDLDASVTEAKCRTLFFI